VADPDHLRQVIRIERIDIQPGAQAVVGAVTTAR